MHACMATKLKWLYVVQKDIHTLRILLFQGKDHFFKEIKMTFLQEIYMMMDYIQCISKKLFSNLELIVLILQRLLNFDFMLNLNFHVF